MKLQQQKEVLQLYYRYQNTEKDIIKTNLTEYMDNLGVKPSEVSKKTNIPIQTIYQIRRRNNNYKPDFFTTLIICDLLKISITATIQPIKLNIPEPKTKWSIKLKKEFIEDYTNLSITELCKKYSIVPRTAQEYYRNFLVDVES